MARPTYTPTEEERERVLQFIDRNSGYKYKGMRVKDYEPALYPKGITSFARCVGLTRPTVSKALNGHPTSRRTWRQIMSEVNVYEKEEDLIQELARMRGISMRKLKRALEEVV